GGMPHSYGASFSGVGFFGPSTPDRPIDVRANPAPRAIMIRMDSQLCIVDQVRLVNKFPSLHANTTTNDHSAARVVLAAAAGPFRRGIVHRRARAAAAARARHRVLPGIAGARFHLAASPRTVRSRRVSARQRAVPRLHVAVSRRVSRTRRTARPAPASCQGTPASQPEAVRLLPARVLVRP